MITPKPCRNPSCRVMVLLVRKAEDDASTIRILRGEKTGYRLEHLREALSMRLAFDDDRPQTPEDFPWHVVHRCESESD